MQLSSINHTRAPSLPSTTGFWRTPLVRGYGESYVSRGTIPAAALGLLGIWDTFRTAANQEGEHFSFWNNLFRPLSWALMAGFTYSVTKPPNNLFQTDLVTNSVKDIVDNIVGKIGDKDSFVQILKKESVENLNTAVDGIMNKSCKVIDTFFDNLKDDRREQTLSMEAIGSLAGRGTPLSDLYSEVIVNQDGTETDYRDRPAKLKELLKDRRGNWLQMLSAQKRSLAEEIISAVFAPEKNESESAQIATIRREINTAIEPMGLTLSAIQYNKSSDQIKLYFINMKGYSNGSNSNDSSLHLLGNIVTVNPGTFLNLAIDTADKVSELSRSENVDEALAGNDGPRIKRLNQEFLGKISEWIPGLTHHNCIQRLHVVYDSTTNTYTYNSLDPTTRITLNDPSMKKLREILGQGSSYSMFGSVAGLGGAYPGPNLRREDPGEMEPVRAGTGNRATGTVADYSELNRDEGVRPKKRLDPAVEKERVESEKLLNLILKTELGIELRKNEDSKLVELKLALVARQLMYNREKSVLGKKALELRKDTFWKNHNSEIEAEKRRIVAEITGRTKDKITDQGAIDKEIAIRLEQYMQTLFDKNFEKECSAGKIKIEEKEIKLKQLSDENMRIINDDYSDSVERVLAALNELLPKNSYCGGDTPGLEGIRKMGELAKNFNLKQFLMVALEGLITRKGDGTKVTIEDKNKLSIKELFRELAKATGDKSTTNAMGWLGKLFKVLDEDQAIGLREQALALKEEADDLSDKARVQASGNDASVSSSAPIKAK